jgi:hydroxymethylpyrimidine/phosphomethylpyrimidine kinase
MASRPLVLVISGLDPSGAGLQADIETCFSLGAHALPVASALTVQSTRGLSQTIAVDPETIREQVMTVAADVGPISACKIGMLPGRGVAEAVADALAVLPPTCCVILDPVIRSSSGGRLMGADLVGGVPEQLLRRVSLVKPNVGEAQELGWLIDGHTPRWHEGQPRYMLVTGADTALDSTASHQLFEAGRLCLEIKQPVIAGRFHGTGCTLTSAIAAYCALGRPLVEAVREGLAFTWDSVNRGYSIGGGQSIPERRPHKEI